MKTSQNDLNIASLSVGDRIWRSWKDHMDRIGNYEITGINGDNVSFIDLNGGESYTLDKSKPNLVIYKSDPRKSVYKEGDRVSFIKPGSLTEHEGFICGRSGRSYMIQLIGEKTSEGFSCELVHRKFFMP